ncbi:septum formation initiator family protein [uncultured Flavonifractor sp.]|uniref:septum formation initiator family protein n=1 Tax=uncultured Flavonifractor sp. TaxID=1193534 RepID=UPI002624E87D|nr:septum formation initiator family protein [uncultured Flavonifractor sp.]
MKLKKASLLTKFVILTLLIGTATGLLAMRSQLQTAQADLAAAQKQVEEQKQINADLADAVENSGDPERQADLARDKLGLVEPGEYVFQFTD